MIFIYNLFIKTKKICEEYNIFIIYMNYLYLADSNIIMTFFLAPDTVFYNYTSSPNHLSEMQRYYFTCE